MRFIHLILFLSPLILFSCSNEKSGNDKKKSGRSGNTRVELPKAPKLFELVKGSGIDFQNINRESNELNVFTYEYFYNGGGVAVGDINNDGLEDVYFTANQGSNRLYLNKGNLKFEDITESAGIEGTQVGWDYGVSMVDINRDGLLDIYVCLSGGYPEEKIRENLLYVNNGDLTFTEKAAEYGLNDPGHSTQAAFFDFDRDGDLDMYLVNHPVNFTRPNSVKLRDKGNPKYISDKLYRNDGNKFVNITDQAGIRNDAFGLSVGISDINRDGWPDVYVANDYIEPDFLYINNGDGTFTESLEGFVRHTAKFGMGTDFADINNDALVDFIVLDMKPADNLRQKTLMGPVDYDTYTYTAEFGFYYQNMRNMLQLNNGLGFSEIGEMAGVSATDWSWSSLFADFDNDGLKDLFISNGYKRDITNIDFKNYYKDEHRKRAMEEGKMKDHLNLYKTKFLANYIFRNEGNLSFSNKQVDWGLAPYKALSQGAAYADFDNDGDLDLIVNNMSDPEIGISKTAHLYQNKANKLLTDRHYLQISLNTDLENTVSVGTKLVIKTENSQQFFEYNPVRGYASSVSRRIHAGIPQNYGQIDVEIYWPDGAYGKLENVEPNQHLTVNRSDAIEERNISYPSLAKAPFYQSESNGGISFTHKEDNTIDFKVEPLLPHKLSLEGPAVARGDINGDGRDDLYIGGANKHSPAIYIQDNSGMFRQVKYHWQERHQKFEDVDALFFDADGDGDDDLVVASGGNHLVSGTSARYQVRLYINDNGRLTPAENGMMPDNFRENASAIEAADFDQDGDLDLFIGARSISGSYPFSPTSALFLNDGKGNFNWLKSALKNEGKIGMITDAISLPSPDGPTLVTCGEYTSIDFWKFNPDKQAFEKLDNGLGHLVGWWNCLVPADVNGDGLIDIIAGNQGLNTRIQVNKEEPVRVYYGDFNEDGAKDAITTYYVKGLEVPLHARDELFKQMTFIRKKFLDFESFGKADIHKILGDLYDSASVLEANTFANSIFINKGNGKYEQREFSRMAQIAPIRDAILFDYDEDGDEDIIAVGNSYAPMSETGRCDASYGWLMQNDGKGNFSVIPTLSSGFHLVGDARRIEKIGSRIICVQNNGPVEVFRYQGINP